MSIEKRMTTIQISEVVWKELNAMKGIGESFEDVLLRLLKLGNEHKDD